MSTDGQEHTRFRSPKTLSTQFTGGQYLSTWNAPAGEQAASQAALTGAGLSMVCRWSPGLRTRTVSVGLGPVGSGPSSSEPVRATTPATSGTFARMADWSLAFIVSVSSRLTEGRPGSIRQARQSSTGELGSTFTMTGSPAVIALALNCVSRGYAAG